MHDNQFIDNLIESLQDADPIVRVHAGFTLGSMGEEAFAAIPALIDLLKHGEPQDRRLAATALGQIGPIAAEAVPALLDATFDDDEGVVEAATAALEEIDLADEDEGLAEAA